MYITTIKKYRIEIIALTSILIINIFLQSPQREFWITAFWVSDDVDNMNVANNLRLGNGFVLSYQNSWQDEYVKPMSYYVNASSILDTYPELNTPYGGKGPIYYLLLGFTYWITDATEKNWNFWGSVLNGIITVCMIIALFLFSKKYFGRNIAIVSAFIVSIATITIIYSVRPLHYPLVYTFIIMSLFFIKGTKRDYILFGIFAGLANLTHPIGILPIVGYGLLLLVKKEFKGLGLVLFSYFLVLLPWFIRNVLLFGGFGYGLGIPYSNKISELLGFQTFSSTSLNPEILGQTFEITKGIFPLDTFRGFYSLYLTEFWHVHIITFILFFIIVAFLSFEGIKKTVIAIHHNAISKRIFSGVKIFSVVSLMIFLLTSNVWAKYITNNPDPLILFTQMLLIFVLPITLLVKLYKSKKEIFEIHISRINFVIGFFILVSLLIYLGYSHQTATPIPELKIIMPIFLIGLPLGIHGLEKITKYFSELVGVYSIKFISKIQNVFFPNLMTRQTKILQKSTTLTFKIKNEQKIGNYVFLLIIVVLCGLALLELREGNHHWFEQSTGAHGIKSSQKDLYNWLNENVVDKNIITASDIPQVIWSQTGLRTVSIPTGELELYNVNNLESFFQKYNVTYIVMHYKYNTWLLDNNLGNKYYFKKVYQSDVDLDWYSNAFYRNYQVYQIYNLSDVNPNDLFAYAIKSIILKEHGMQKEAYEIYSNLINSGQISKIDLLTQFRLHLAFDNLDGVANVFNNIYSSNHLLDFKSLVSYYINTGQIERLYTIVDSVNKIIDAHPNNLGALDFQLSIYERTGLDKSLPSKTQFITILNADVEDHKLPIWGDIVNILTKIDDTKYAKLAANLFKNATILDEQGNYEQALKAYKKTQHISGYSHDSLTAQIRILTKLKQYESALNSYDIAIRFYENEIKSHLLSAIDKELTQKSLIESLRGKALLLTNLEEYRDADRTYAKLLAIDQFDRSALNAKVFLLEKLGRFNEAIIAYEFLMKLEEDHSEIQKKIDELKDKIANQQNN